MAKLSVWHKHIWDLAEPAWREYKSAQWYVELLRAEGFTVEAGSASMPTAFSAEWSHGSGGPVLLTYAEYDAVPGNCQSAGTEPAPRGGPEPLRPRAHRPALGPGHLHPGRPAGHQARHGGARHCRHA